MMTLAVLLMMSGLADEARPAAATAAQSGQSAPATEPIVLRRSIEDRDESTGGAAPRRIRNVTLAGEEACPESSGDEIVVCQRLDEPFRIPKEFRELAPSAANQSWVNRASTIDEVSRVSGGLPNTCSPVGTGGQTGCNQKLIQQYYEEQREAARRNARVP